MSFELPMSSFLKRERKERFLTQKQLAAELKVSVSTLRSWEGGRHLPHLYNLEQIADVFDMSLSEVIEHNHYGML